MGHVSNGRCFRCDGTGVAAPKGAAPTTSAAQAFEGALSSGVEVTVGGRAAVVVAAMSNGRYAVKFAGRAGTHFVDAKEVIA